MCRPEPSGRSLQQEVLASIDRVARELERPDGVLEIAFDVVPLGGQERVVARVMRQASLPAVQLRVAQHRVQIGHAGDAGLRNADIFRPERQRCRTSRA